MAGKTVSVTDESFDASVIRAKVPVLVDFWAPWCGPCLAVGPILDEIASEMGDQAKIVKMNVDENANIPAQFGVRSIPFMVLFKDGQVVDSVVGAVPKAKIKSMIEKNL